MARQGLRGPKALRVRQESMERTELRAQTALRDLKDRKALKDRKGLRERRVLRLDSVPLRQRPHRSIQGHPLPCR